MSTPAASSLLAALPSCSPLRGCSAGSTVTLLATSSRSFAVLCRTLLCLCDTKPPRLQNQSMMHGKWLATCTSALSAMASCISARCRHGTRLHGARIHAVRLATLLARTKHLFLKRQLRTVEVHAIQHYSLWLPHQLTVVDGFD